MSAEFKTLQLRLTESRTVAMEEGKKVKELNKSQRELNKKNTNLSTELQTSQVLTVFLAIIWQITSQRRTILNE